MSEEKTGKTAKEEAAEQEIYDIESLVDPSTELDIPYPDPEFHYRWVNSKLKNRLARFLRAGYTFVEGKHAEKLYGKQADMFLSAAGRIEVGDLALMAVPIGRYEKIRELIARKGREQVADETDRFLAETSQIARGVSGFVQDRAEYEDMKRVAERGQDSRVGYTGVKGR